ncbi:GNAT family N-acetyltransferase [Phenylobacterium sp.]|uniref:GNAT family N-acetyltransferase n=1 Tax=Phenylobacterium sp. TaxID=1871053 RepID=UPI0027249FF2|nr:GNAT family N-acetyltransferase [Phenylobacterium sp.]MDO8799505.1 GNAT family N-acetyltransferase [Phenylobacterium sp.]
MTGAAHVETIERATLAAVAPEEVLEIDGWLVGLDPGSIRRAASAVPLRHDLPADPAVLDQIEAAYVQRGLKPAFRVADDPGLEAVRAELARRGYAFEQPTLVKTAAAGAIAAVTDRPTAEIADRPDDAWAAVFLGEGFDPVDGAYRVKALSRAPGGRFGMVRDGGRTVAVGCGSFGHGWVSFHGMRTDLSRRGEGLAGRVLAGLANEALARGVDRAFLQVEEKNTPARALYRRAGFAQAWRYFYWSKPA